MHRLERETYLRVINPRMISGHLQGKLLEMLVRMLRPKRVLEIGTFTGYSGLSIARGLDDDALLDTIEVDDELEEIAAKYFEASEYGHRIRQHVGSALDVVPQLGEVYDMVFIDGDKREYPAYYNMLMEGGYVRSGSFMLADNIFLWVASVPLGAIAGLVLGLPAFWIYFFLKIDQVLKAVWCVIRLRSGKWIKKIKTAEELAG